jgi:phosphate/sulfate permease
MTPPCNLKFRPLSPNKVTYTHILFMETIYLCIIIFLFVLAVFDLIVGVSNDAVNFLNSAVGAKAASFKTILFIAGIGIFIGAALSNGMMDIARHGIYQPEHFYFTEIMCILLAVMLTDVVLLDVFNSMGMPTSTTVSLVFELLGGTFALSLIKVHNSDTLGLGDLINTDKALSVIMAIFVSVAIAFFFGMLVQWIARVIFTFNYKKKMKYSIALFGGIAATSIIYFMLIKGLKDSSFMTPDNKLWIQENTWLLIATFFVFFTILMQVLHWLKVNVFKVVVLMGTFALALAFAGNDLVNFIGVPLAGFSSFMDYTANGTGNANGFLMTSLLGPAKTPWYFLIGAGAVMVYALCTSKKAHAVIKTSVDLSRQDEGEETFGSTPIARTVVRISMTMANSISRIMSSGTKEWFNSRFRKDEAIIADGAAFDLVRASVNLVLAGLLIALGTSLKLPLSTTYVTFMVAMGTSLADRAWGRDSAVYRITGVLSVIGGWFITAGAAFTICFFVALVLHYGGNISIIALIALAVFILIRSQVMYKKRKAKAQGNETLKQLMQTSNSEEALQLMRKHTREELAKVLEYAETNFELTVTSFLHENLRGLRRAMGSTKFEKQLIKQMKRTGTVAMCRLDNNTVLDKGLYYYQGNDFASELVYSISRLCEPCLEHIDNNFNPLDAIQKGEFSDATEDITYLIQQCRKKLENNEYNNLEEEIRRANDLNGQLSLLKRKELQRIQSQPGSIRVSMVYLTMVQEAQNVVTYTINLMKVSRKFQMENEMP